MVAFPHEPQTDSDDDSRLVTIDQAMACDLVRTLFRLLLAIQDDKHPAFGEPEAYRTAAELLQWLSSLLRALIEEQWSSQVSG